MRWLLTGILSQWFINVLMEWRAPCQQEIKLFVCVWCRYRLITIFVCWLLEQSYCILAPVERDCVGWDLPLQPCYCYNTSNTYKRQSIKMYEIRTFNGLNINIIEHNVFCFHEVTEHRCKTNCGQSTPRKRKDIPSCTSRVNLIYEKNIIL